MSGTDQSPQLQTGAGFFHCDHCSHVAELPEDSEVTQTYKCKRCHKWAVRWRFPMAPKPARETKAAAPETAAAGFAALHAAVEGAR